MNQKQTDLPELKFFDYLHDVTVKAKKAGAEHAEVMFKKSHGISLKTERNEISDITISGPQMLGVRVFKNDRVGISFTEDLSDLAVDFMLQSALGSTQFLEEDKAQKLYTAMDQKGPAINIHPKNLAPLMEFENLSLDHKKNMTLELERLVLSQSPLVKGAPYNGLRENSGEFFLANDQGAVAFSKSSNISCYTSALLESGEKKSMIYDSLVARSYSHLDLETLAQTTFQKAHTLLEGKSLNSGKYHAIFETDILAEIFAAFSSVFSAKTALENKNPLAQSLGMNIGHKNLSVMDIPDFDLAFDHSLFDDEGAIQSPLNLISAGEMANFFHNSKTSKMMNLKNNSRAARSPQGQLNVSGTNTVIGLGKLKKNDLYSGKVFYVMDSQGLHASTNVMSGNFSMGAKGVIMQEGKITEAVKDVTLSLNFFDMLKGMELLGDEIKANSEKNFFSPEIRFQNLELSGSST